MPRHKNYSGSHRDQRSSRRRVVPDLDRIAAALISFACIYVALFLNVEFDGFAGIYGPWAICGVPIAVALLLISLRRLTIEAWKLWLFPFVANLAGMFVMGLPFFYALIHMHEI